jgi:hypothetical protein
LYDHKAVFYREQNKYHLFKDGVEYIVRAHHMKTNLALVTTSQMKMIVNASRKFALMAVKCESLESGNLEHGIELIKSVPEYGALLQGPEGLSLTRDVQHEVQLQQSMPLPNLGMNRMIIQKTVHDYVRNCVMCNTIDKGLGLYTPIHTSSRPYKDVDPWCLIVHTSYSFTLFFLLQFCIFG